MSLRDCSHTGEADSPTYVSMVAADRVRVVADVLAELSHRHRAVIGLRYGAGWTQRHIARFAGCSREAVAGLERRALGEFRRRLAARGIRGTENI